MPNQRKAGKRFVSSWVETPLYNKIAEMAEIHKTTVSGVITMLAESAFGINSDGTPIKKTDKDGKG